MTNRSRLALLSFVLTAGIGVALAQNQNPETTQTKDPAPDITGAWTGTVRGRTRVALIRPSLL